MGSVDHTTGDIRCGTRIRVYTQVYVHTRISAGPISSDTVSKYTRNTNEIYPEQSVSTHKYMCRSSRALDRYHRTRCQDTSGTPVRYISEQRVSKHKFTCTYPFPLGQYHQTRYQNTSAIPARYIPEQSVYTQVYGHIPTPKGPVSSNMVSKHIRTPTRYISDRTVSEQLLMLVLLS